MAKQPIIGIMYDFDKTLSTTDMQNYDFIPKLGLTPDEFWGATGEFTAKTGVERILSYMYMMIAKAKEKGIKLTREYLRECGKNIKFYPGVTTWFKRINDYAESKGIKVEHYLVSSGTMEIVEGCSIFPCFTKAWGCEYYYNEDGEPVWPKLAINYTQKTQYLFRICKDATDITDEGKVNSRVDKKHVEFRNMIYIGDGLTDIPCMTLVKEKGGTAISVYTPEKKEESVHLLKDDRVNYACKSDFRSGSQLEKLIKQILDCIKLKEILIAKEQSKKVK